MAGSYLVSYIPSQEYLGNSSAKNIDTVKFFKGIGTVKSTTNNMGLVFKKNNLGLVEVQLIELESCCSPVLTVPAHVAPAAEIIVTRSLQGSVGQSTFRFAAGNRA